MKSLLIFLMCILYDVLNVFQEESAEFYQVTVVFFDLQLVVKSS
ncbi:hypothetical protein [Desemzia sp. RIT 804]|nr:hypothetical protein [Desemzia sp. RIT 804]